MDRTRGREEQVRDPHWFVAKCRRQVIKSYTKKDKSATKHRLVCLYPHITVGVTTCTEETECTNETMAKSACVHCRESTNEASSIMIKVE